ncbi:FRAS1-related extracellular matrix protein 1-like [Struthio camelus]|uniref:FRAS1-related extracellular matrix protein 1-like n=1 Tax=Struthio camelus TaxID=8801 RepID=UPI003603F1EA
MASTQSKGHFTSTSCHSTMKSFIFPGSPSRERRRSPEECAGETCGGSWRLLRGDIVLLAKPVTLTEGDRVTLTTDVLMATDGTSKPEKLLYAVSVPPVHGQIEYINYPGVPISSYSQLDVVAQKVCDVHDNSHEASKDSFSCVGGGTRQIISKTPSEEKPNHRAELERWSA